MYKEFRIFVVYYKHKKAEKRENKGSDDRP